MQHPEEGTIHSWLDGALSAEDATRIESHVAECAECRTAVAEARGFIAASSRILTALDDVPSGVMPAAAPRKRDLRYVWRAAAAMLVVAGGSLIVMRDGGENASTVDSKTESAQRTTAPTSASANTVADGAAEAGSTARLATPPPEASTLSEKRAAPAPARVANPGAATTRDLRRETSATQSYSAEPLRGSVGGVVEQSIAPDAVSKTGVGAGVLQAAGPVAPLKVLSVARTIGSRRTLYEVAQGDTVTLMETDVMRLEEVVTTGAAGMSAAPPSAQRRSNASGARAVAPMADRAAATPPPPPVVDSPTKRDAAGRAATGAMAKTAVSPLEAVSSGAARINTISWTDPATGRTLTLSGKLPVARLQEIKLRIEQERAAAGGKAP